MRRGYLSVIALPLKTAEGRVFGNLTIYSPRRDAFNPEEVSLLEELANDLAYGVCAIRLREHHRLDEEALEKSEANYRAAVDYSPELISMFDRDRRFLCTNRSISLVTDLSPEEAVGKRITELPTWANPEVAAGWDKVIGEVLATGKPSRDEVELEASSGRVIIDCRVYPVLATDGSVRAGLQHQPRRHGGAAGHRMHTEDLRGEGNPPPGGSVTGPATTCR